MIHSDMIHVRMVVAAVVIPVAMVVGITEERVPRDNDDLRILLLNNNGLLLLTRIGLLINLLRLITTSQKAEGY